MKHYKELLCPVCGTVELFRGKRDGAYHCPVCNTGIYYNNGVVKGVKGKVDQSTHEPQETEPAERKRSHWRYWEYWRGFFFLPGFLGRKLRQITKYASKVAIVD